ncbi:MAG: thioredoxin-like domain-containing protein [Pirellulales bacterium]
MAIFRKHRFWMRTGAVILAFAAACVLARAPAWRTPRATAQAAQAAQTAANPRAAAARAGVKAPANMADNPFPGRVPAPSLAGGVAWINTSGPLDLEDLHGKFVLLDFWTYCCINCMHVLPEVKKLEKAYSKDLVVVGVHSGKFDAERDAANIADAVLRYEIDHPVVNDANRAIWDRYGIRTWPTLVLIDPQGKAIHVWTGETSFEAFDRVLKPAAAYYRRKGVVNETPLRFDLERFKNAAATPLRFPGKVLADEPGKRLFIADSNHNRVVVTRLDGTWLETIGSGKIGSSDGAYAAASFNHPQGMALTGDTLYVADTENHRVRAIDLAAKRVATIAGVGRQAPSSMASLRGGKPRETPLSSPWDLWIQGANLYVAMAGSHQIWRIGLDGARIGPYAGNGVEDIVDGPLLPKRPYELGSASFAQPSGLASDGRWLYVADSEGSSIRAVPFNPSGRVQTLVGTSRLAAGRLFTFGDVDGPADRARLQHCLGLVDYQGLLYVADTYNDKVKAIDPKTGTVRTLAGTERAGHDAFNEPAGITAAAGKLYVADTNNHRIQTIDLAAGNRVATLEITGLTPPSL